MDETAKKKNDTWYIKKQEKVSGPFPSKLIGSYLILGRIDLDTLVSPDKEKWIPVGRLPSLIPPEVKNATTDAGKEALERARLREDERRSESRREGEERRQAERNKEERRQIKDRRENDHGVSTAYRKVIQDLAETQAEEKKENRIGLTLVSVVAVVVLISFFVLDPISRDDGADCSAPAAPGVNWQFCNKGAVDLVEKELTAAQLNSARLEGARLVRANLLKADLSYANLQSANLQQARLEGVRLVGASLQGASLVSADLTRADLSYADLTGARLDGATIKEAIFDNAIWSDGTRCARGSVGGCIPAPRS